MNPVIDRKISELLARLAWLLDRRAMTDRADQQMRLGWGLIRQQIQAFVLLGSDLPEADVALRADELRQFHPDLPVEPLLDEEAVERCRVAALNLLSDPAAMDAALDRIVGQAYHEPNFTVAPTVCRWCGRAARADQRFLLEVCVVES